MKRFFDIIVSLIVLLLTFPVIIVISILIKLEDGGPVLYKANRVGLNDSLFIMYKFRTMIVNAETLGPSSTSADDVRITRIGGFLRKYKIDEITQFINVLKGDMSIVGPRPEVKKFTDIYTEEEKRILTVKPGITDWASIWNSNEGKILEGEEDPDKVYMEMIRPEKIRLQLKYVNKHNFLIDLEIIFLTVRKVLIGK